VEKSSRGQRVSTIDSLAVLPLENVSGDPETEYLSDGIAETLINTLAQLRKIRVVPRTLSFQYRGEGINSLAAGRELGVRAVLAGRMVQRGDDLIVSVELVDVNRQAQLWGGRYNRKMTDLIGLQEELTTEIAEKLRLQLTGEEKKKLRKRPTQNNEAFRLVLEARHATNKLSPQSLRKAIALCQQAIEIDPTYAPAYAVLSDACAMQDVYGYAAPSEIQPRMKWAAQKALELDDTLADAHVSLARGLLYYRGDVSGAEKEVRRSLELNPDSSGAYDFLRLICLCRGRFEDAIAAAKRAADLDPFSSIAELGLGTAYFYARRFDMAIEHLCNSLEADSQNLVTLMTLSLAYAYAGQPKRAVERCEQLMALAPGVVQVHLLSGAAYAKVGKTEEAHKTIEEAERAWKPGGGSSFWIAAVHACLGEKDPALEWLEKAIQERASAVLFLKVHPLFDGLLGDPRFDDLVKRIGIPDN
jgi:serine/threonine-protein kinase